MPKLIVTGRDATTGKPTTVETYPSDHAKGS